MYKKNIALFALLVSVNYISAEIGYPATGGYQAGDHHRHHNHQPTISKEDKNMLDDLDTQIAAINEAGRDPYHRIELAYLAGAVGVIMLAIGAHDKHTNTVAMGGILTVGAVGGGMLASHGDHKREEERQKNKRDLMDRKETILKAYRNN